MPKPQSRLNKPAKIILLASLVFTLLVAAKLFNFQLILSKSIIWVSSLGVWGPIAFIVIYNLATLLFIPGSLLTLKGGCLFGFLWGTVYVLIAAIIGSVLAFLVGRYLSRGWISVQINQYPKFKAIDKAVTQEGWKIVLLTRLSPLFPFNLLNYAFGITQVSLKDYVLGSIGIVPGTVMYVYIGSIAGNLSMINMSHQLTSPETQIWQWILQGVGLIATFTVTIYTARVAKKALAQSVAIAEAGGRR